VGVAAMIIKDLRQDVAAKHARARSRIDEHRRTGTGPMTPADACSDREEESDRESPDLERKVSLTVKE